MKDKEYDEGVEVLAMAVAEQLAIMIARNEYGIADRIAHAAINTSVASWPSYTPGTHTSATPTTCPTITSTYADQLETYKAEIETYRDLIKESPHKSEENL